MSPITLHVWHITHRCHKQEFLLKFEKDRSRWLWWLFEAKKRYGTCIFNYMGTSNHIHLLLYDIADRECIPRTIQLIAGRTGQEFNQRKRRKGAFWEDRYHATTVESDEHLIQCLVYLDLNMVRAGVVGHPSEGGGVVVTMKFNNPESDTRSLTTYNWLLFSARKE